MFPEEKGEERVSPPHVFFEGIVAIMAKEVGKGSSTKGK